MLYLGRRLVWNDLFSFVLWRDIDGTNGPLFLVLFRVSISRGLLTSSYRLELICAQLYVPFRLLRSWRFQFPRLAFI